MDLTVLKYILLIVSIPLISSTMIPRVSSSDKATPQICEKGEQVNGLTPFDQVQGVVDFFTTFLDNNFVIGFFLLGLGYLLYLFVALHYHRRDQRRLVRIALIHKVNIRHNFSWRGVTAEVTHPHQVQENKGITESPGREG